MKNTAKYFDLYGMEIARIMLMKKGYKAISFRKNSIPSQGSPTLRINKLSFNDDIKVIRTILHRNSNVTVVTDKAYYQFIK